MGRGEGEHLRGGTWQGKKARKSTDPKIEQECIVLEIFVVYYDVLISVNCTHSRSITRITWMKRFSYSFGAERASLVS